IFSSTLEVDAERAAILYGRRAVVGLSARCAATGSARASTAVSRLSGSGTEFHTGVHLHGGEKLNGIIVVDKPETWTSHDVVNRMRRLADTKKVGHLGTLDPIATGVLPLVVGRATRLAQFYTRSDKIYEGVVRFGWSTNTYDRAGERVGPLTEAAVDPEQLERL